MCNYLYYWVTVRNSQSYWHLEHMRETLACTRGRDGGGGQQGGGGGGGSQSDGGGGAEVGTRTVCTWLCVSG